MPTADDLVRDAAGAPADVFVLFGAAGDLARRKTFPALYRLERQSQLPPLVIGVARRDWVDPRRNLEQLLNTVALLVDGCFSQRAVQAGDGAVAR